LHTMKERTRSSRTTQKGKPLEADNRLLSCRKQEMGIKFFWHVGDSTFLTGATSRRNLPKKAWKGLNGRKKLPKAEGLRVSSPSLGKLSQFSGELSQKGVVQGRNGMARDQNPKRD